MESPPSYNLQIGQVLRYPRAQEEPPEYVDDCLNFRWIAAYEGAGGFQMESGINTPRAVRVSDGSDRRPAIIISSSPYKKGSLETPWQDFFDPDNGHIRYFGDNKDPGKDPANAPGNKALLAAFQLAHSHDPSLRAQTPPLLFFKRKRKGFAAFQGFGVIQSVDLRTQWDNKKTIDQKPIPGSETDKVLNQIYDYYSEKKHHFEALAELIAERVIGADRPGYEKGWITAAGGDGGADFVASVRLGSDFSSAKIIVLGQAKCVGLNSPTHGNHIARTVARLKRGWIGAFVTTSYFSEAVQQEIIEDSYPIVLVHGKRIAEEVIKIVHDDDRYPDVVALLDELSASYPNRIQQANPEELLR